MKHQTSSIIRPDRGSRSHIIIRSLGLAALALAISNGSAQYTFVNVADTKDAAPSDGTPFKSFGAPSISGGTAAFIGMYNGFPNQGIFTGDGAAVATVADTTSSLAPDGTLFNAFGPPSMTGDQTAFWGLYRRFASHGIFLGSPDLLTTIARVGTPAPVGTFGFLLPDIAASDGVVAFTAMYGGFDYAGIFTGTGGGLTTIVTTDDPAPSGWFYDFSSPSISKGAVAFVGWYGGRHGIFTGSGGALTTIVETGDAAPSGTFNFFVATNPPSISGETVAFVGYYGSGHGVFTGSGGVLTAIVKTGDAAPSGTFTSLVGPSISGDSVAFTGYYSSGHGIFTSNDGELNTVIQTGDVLFDSTVTALFLNRLGLDGEGSGSLTFRYSLADGRSGVAIASPLESPECPCDAWTVSSFGPPMGRKMTLRSTLPVKFQLFFDGTEVVRQEQLDQILADAGCPPSCPALTIYELSSMEVVAGGGIASNVGDVQEGHCFRPADGNWIYNLRLDPGVFSRGKTYMAEVSIGDCVFVGQGNNLFEVR